MGFSLTNWQSSWPLKFSIALFGLLWVHALLPLMDGNLAILTSVVFAGALAALRAEVDELAGALLAFGTVKAEAGILFLIFFILWSASQKRWGVLTGFIMSLILLGGIGWIFQQDWLLEFFRATLANIRASSPLGLNTLLEQWMPGAGERGSQALTVFVIVILLFEWNAARMGEFRHMFWTAMLTLTLTPLIGLPSVPSNYVLLYLPLLLVLSTMDARWGAIGRWVAIIVMIVMFVGLWLLWNSAQNQLSALYVPLPVGLTLLLYWVRWWSVRPPRTWLDQVSSVTGRM